MGSGVHKPWDLAGLKVHHRFQGQVWTDKVRDDHTHDNNAAKLLDAWFHARAYICPTPDCVHAGVPLQQVLTDLYLMKQILLELFTWAHRLQKLKGCICDKLEMEGWPGLSCLLVGQIP